MSNQKAPLTVGERADTVVNRLFNYSPDGVVFFGNGYLSFFGRLNEQTSRLWAHDPKLEEVAVLELHELLAPLTRTEELPDNNSPPNGHGMNKQLIVKVHNRVWRWVHVVCLCNGPGVWEVLASSFRIEDARRKGNVQIY